MISAFPNSSLSPFNIKGEPRPVEVFDNSSAEKIVEPIKVPGATQFQPLVIFFFGRRGQGKTLGMTAIGKIMAERYGRRNLKNKVFSNYWTDFSHSDPYLVDKLNNFPEWAEDGIIMIDEVSSAFPSTRSMANVNVLFTNFLTQIRKRNMEIMFTTQFPSTVSHALLMQVDLFLLTEKIQGGRGIRFYVFDYWGQWTGKFNKKRWPPEKEEADWSWTLHNTDRIFGSYNTSEVVAAIHSDSRDDIIEAGWQFSTEEEEAAEEPEEDASHDEIDNIIIQSLRLGEKIDIDGLFQAIKVGNPDGIIQRKTDLKPYWTKHGLTVVTIDKKQWAAAI